MTEAIQNFLQTRPGKIAAGVLVLIFLTAAVLSLKSTFGLSEAVASSHERIFVCSETGKSFKVELTAGMKFPVISPYSGRETGYEYDEVCSWTADGKVSEDPTYVLLNKTVKKKGPTFCPVCHRLVVANNPPAEPGMTPPPTEDEYKSRNKTVSALR